MASLNPGYTVKVVEVTEVDRTAATVDFTFAGFGTPTFALIFWGQSAPGAGSRANAYNYGSFGVWTSGGQWCTAWASDSAQATSATARTSSNSMAVVASNTSNVRILEYTASAITDGIRLTKTTNTQIANKTVQVMLFKGASIKNVNVGDFNANGATHAALNGGGGWEPNYALLSCIGANSPNANASAYKWSLGWCLENQDGAGSGTFKQGCIGAYSQNAASTTNVGAYFSDSKCLVDMGTGTIEEMTGSSFSTTGLNFTETFATDTYVHYIAMELEVVANDADICIDRLSGFLFDEAGTNALEKVGMTAKDDNLAGAVICAGSAVSAKDTQDSTSSYLGVGRVSIKDPTGTHGGFCWAEEDNATTTNCGGAMQGPHWWRMPSEDLAGGGRMWEAAFFDRQYGGEFVFDEDYGTLPTGYKEFSTALCWGRGTREIYNGSDVIGVVGGDGSTEVDVYKGSTKIYGDPDLDN